MVLVVFSLGFLKLFACILRYLASKAGGQTF